MDETFESLRLPKGNLGPIAAPKRVSAIRAAQSWPIGTQSTREYVVVFESGEFHVALGKPGKEAADVWKGKRKPHDMAPTMFYRQQPLDFFPTFENLFQHIEDARLVASESADSVLEALASLFFRSAYMLDHEYVNHSKPTSGFHALGPTWRPAVAVIDFVVSKVPTMGPTFRSLEGEVFQLPTGVYLHLIEAIALNEDVKYQGDRVNTSSTVEGNSGRVNNLCTMAMFIAAELGLVRLSDFAAKLIKSRGVSHLTRKAAESYFPMLRAQT